MLLFLLLEGAALWHYAASTPYTEAKMLARTTAVGGAISGMVTDVKHFFSLADENRNLTSRIAELEQQLGVVYELKGEDSVDSLLMAEVYGSDAQYRYHAARVSSITTTRKRNYIVLDKGSDDGIAPNMGVITPHREFVGYIISCSEHYSVVLPMLNTEFHIGGRLVDNNELCKLQWNGSSSERAQLVDLSFYAQPVEGMTVNVSSPRLPDDVLVGHIISFQSNSQKTAYSAEISIATRFSTLDNVLVVENMHYDEIDGLLNEVNASANN